MSRAGMLRAGIDSLFEDAAVGARAAMLIPTLIRVLLEKEILDRDDIVSIAQRLTDRAEDMSGPDGDTFFAADMRDARDELLASLKRDPGLEITVTEPTFEQRLADKTVRPTVA